MWTQNVDELKQKTLKTFGAPFKNSHDILLAEGILISISEYKQNLKKLQKLESKTRPLWQKLLNTPVEGCSQAHVWRFYAQINSILQQR